LPRPTRALPLPPPCPAPPRGLLPLLILLAAGCAGSPPGPAGKVEARAGQLAPCPASPNCVSSLAPADDAEHHVAPISVGADRQLALVALRRAATGLPGATLAALGPDYLRVECSSAVFGFVDDLEITLDPALPLAHVRSASRVGHSDLGVNRERVEALRAALARPVEVAP
jgi:uncharacterized protein (DUF1499 family)